MGDLSKREKRRQRVQALRLPGDPYPEPPRRHRGTPAVFEVNLKSAVTFVRGARVGGATV